MIFPLYSNFFHFIYVCYKFAYCSIIKNILILLLCRRFAFKVIEVSIQPFCSYIWSEESRVTSLMDEAQMKASDHCHIQTCDMGAKARA